MQPRALRLSALLLLFTGSCFAQILPHPYLFEAQKGGKSLYLFGTLHVGVGIYDLPPEVIGALKRQSVYVTETLKNGDDGANPQDQGSAPSPKSAALDKPAAAKPFDAFTLNQLKARGFSDKWVSIAQRLPRLACTLYENYEGLRDHLILDEQLENLATQEQKTKIALDDADAMSKLNRKNEGECDIARNVKAIPGRLARENYLQQLEDYRRGELKDAQVDEPGDTHAVAERNQAWMKSLLKYFPRSEFVAVGYGHLGGKQGLLQLLKENGFKVWRLEGKTRKGI